MYSDLGWKLRMKSKYSRVCKGYRLFALRSVGTNGYVLCLLRSNFALRRLSNDSDLLLSSGRDPGLVRFRRSTMNCSRRIGGGQCRDQYSAPVMMVAHLTSPSACFARSWLMTVAVTTKPGD